VQDCQPGDSLKTYKNVSTRDRENPGVRTTGRDTRAGSRAFTLLELMIVLSILAILASLTLVVGRSVSERSKVSQAKAEMAVLAAALEQYKQQYGDYPWTPDGTDGGLDMEGGAILFNALCGNLGPQAKVKLSTKGRTFVELSRFTLDYTDDDHLPHPIETTLRTNWFNDPWGRWYYYRYRRSANDGAWKSKGFLLYSHGPDLDCDLGNPDTDVTRPVRTGLLENFPEGSDSKNRDNIYHGRD
jgi:prepilin-type N-terminal cleavage/methylation domain-containing protein